MKVAEYVVRLLIVKLRTTLPAEFKTCALPARRERACRPQDDRVLEAVTIRTQDGRTERACLLRARTATGTERLSGLARRVHGHDGELIRAGRQGGERVRTGGRGGRLHHVAAMDGSHRVVVYGTAGVRSRPGPVQLTRSGFVA